MAVEVILVEDIPSLGAIGEVVRVKPGYSRNYLLPRGLAVPASAKGKRELAHQQRVLGFRREKVRKDAEAVAHKLQGIELTFERKVGEQDKLFGSVTTIDIERALEEKGVAIDRRRLHLAEPIKTLGTQDVSVRLSSGVVTKIKVTVVAEPA